MADKYWVNGSGNISDYTNHLSTTSGGEPDASALTSSDNLIVDGNSTYLDSLWGWGRNAYGQVGDGGFTDRLSPVRVSSTSTWKYIGKGYASIHSNAVRYDDTLWAWGYNLYGRLGDGGTTNRSSPVQIGTSTWKMSTTGSSHSHAIRGDDTLWGWGYNLYGHVGDGGTTNRSSPVQIGTSTWKYVSSGGYGGHAIRGDDTLWGWGYNAQNQIGDGSGTERHAPVKIGASTWKFVVSGHYGSHAILNDATLWGWGYNAGGVVGDGGTTARSSPVKIGTSTWKLVCESGWHCLAIRGDDTLWSWGRNTYGQLGDGGTTDSVSPIQVGTSTWKSIAVGGSQYTYSLAIRGDDTLWAWGYNLEGQLGDGTTTNRLYPVQIGSKIWAMIAVHFSHCTGMKL